MKYSGMKFGDITLNRYTFTISAFPKLFKFQNVCRTGGSTPLRLVVNVPRSRSDQCRILTIASGILHQKKISSRKISRESSERTSASKTASVT
jgi:hypothetical protein